MRRHGETLIAATYLSIERVRHGERAGNPTERVDDMRRDAADNATDRLPHILGGSDHQAAGQQQDGREDVVQPKDGVVRQHLLRLEVFLKSAEQLIHDCEFSLNVGRWNVIFVR